MKTVTVKDLVIGTAHLKSSSRWWRKISPAWNPKSRLSWSGLWYSGMACGPLCRLSNVESVMAAAKILRETMPENRCCLPSAVPKKAASRRFPRGLYCTQSCSHRQRPGWYDRLELFTGDDQVKETVAYAHALMWKLSCPTMTSIKRRKPKKHCPSAQNAVLRRRYS